MLCRAAVSTEGEDFLRQIRAVQNRTLLFTLICILLGACSRPAGQPENQAQNKPAPAAHRPKNIWISETTGKEYRVTIENDVLRAEWVNIPPDYLAQGEYIRTECKRVGSKWVGTSSIYIACTLEGGAKPKPDNWCHLQTQFEIDSVAADRITGRTEAMVKFDCLKCKILKSEMKDFLWTPRP